MSNSSLVNYTKLSPNYNPRKDAISKITIHHMAGNLSVETCANVFNGKRQASSNYGIGSDGRVGLYVEEKNRAWTSSNASNDHKAVTIEVANDGGANTNWHVSDKALAKLIDLCTDICKRNGIKRLNYTGDASGNLTRHNMFVATTCPGGYLQSKFPYIANEVNKRLNVEQEVPIQKQETPTTSKFNIGDKVVISGDLYKSSNASTPSGHILNKTTIITRYAPGSKHPYNTTGDLGWIDEKSITLVGSQASIRTYTVAKGDTLSGIAQKLGISDWKVLYNNNKDVIGSNPNVIKVGQILKY